MSVEYMGLSEIHGPLVVLDGVKDAFFEEIVEIKVNGKIRTGRIIEITGETVIVQVVENTDQYQNTAFGKAFDDATGQRNFRQNL